MNTLFIHTVNAVCFSSVSSISEGMYWNLKALKKGNKDDEMVCIPEMAKWAGTSCWKGRSLEGDLR